MLNVQPLSLPVTSTGLSVQHYGFVLCFRKAFKLWINIDLYFIYAFWYTVADPWDIGESSSLLQSVYGTSTAEID